VTKEKYRNKFEQACGEALSGLAIYEPNKIPYVVHRNYIPDFVGPNTEGDEIIIEAKGFFRVGDIQKYKAIRDSLATNQELVFILYTPGKLVRKGGRMSMAQWCDKENIQWFTVEDIADVFK